jgi:hypothetical protein
LRASSSSVIHNSDCAASNSTPRRNTSSCIGMRSARRRVLFLRHSLIMVPPAVYLGTISPQFPSLRANPSVTARAPLVAVVEDRSACIIVVFLHI